MPSLPAILFLVLLTSACVGTGASSGTSPTPSQSGAAVWAANCKRCHFMRPPNSHTIDQTKTVMLHMRIRANMTAEDTAKILQFLTGEEED